MRSFAVLSILFAASLSALAVPLGGNPVDTAKGAVNSVEQALHAKLPARQLSNPLSSLGSVAQLGAVTGALGGVTGKRDDGVDALTAKLPADKVDAALAKAEQKASRDVAPPSTQSVVIIVQNTFTQVTPLCQKLQYVNKANATVESIKPVILEIQTHLSKATSDLKVLVDLKLATSVLLKGADGVVITVGVLAKLVAIDLILIVRSLSVLVAALDGDVKTVIVPLLYTLGNILYGLVAVLLSVVVGLVAELTPLVVSISADISALGFVSLAALLKL